MKAWPEENELPSMEDLVSPLYKALQFLYELERKNEGKDVPYKGYDIGARERVCCLSPDIALTQLGQVEEADSLHVDNPVRLIQPRLSKSRNVYKEPDTGKLAHNYRLFFHLGEKVMRVGEANELVAQIEDRVRDELGCDLRGRTHRKVNP